MGLFDRFKKNGKHQTGNQDKSRGSEPMYLYSEEELAAYEAFIQERFAPFDKVFHEIISPDIHLDIIVLPPTEERNFFKLITMGVGAYRMNVPAELRDQELERMELMLFLPPDWNIGSGDERDYWPLRWLKVLGRYPLQANTWLGLGHSISTSEDDTPVADNTGFAGFLLLNGLDLAFEPLEFRLPGGEQVNFYQVFPLYPEEVRFKMSHGMQALLERFDGPDILPVVNIHRKNYGVEP